MERTSRGFMLDLCRQNHNYSLQLNRWFLKPIGAWPEKLPTNSMTRNILKQILRLMCHILIAFTVVPSILYILFEERNFRLQLKAIGPTSHCLMGSINYCSLLYQGERIRKSIEHMETDWRLTKREHDREMMSKNARMGRIVTGVCALIMQGGVLCYNLARGTSRILVTLDNETVAIGRLPCPSFNMIVDTRFSPVYEVVLILQCLSLTVVNSTTVGVCGLAAVFAMHACGQLSVVMSRLEELVDEKRETLQLRLANIVERHLRVLRFLTRMEKILRQICFVELVGCTFNLCMLGYYIITEWYEESMNTIITYIMVLMSMMFNIFIFCFIGELVTEQCKKVGQAAYMTNWYHLPHKTALGLILIILRSNIAIKITAGKIFYMSISTFGVVIRTSVAYLNMLRTLTM